MPVMMMTTESQMKMLKELYASIYGEDQCSSFIVNERQDRVVDIHGSVVTIRSLCEPSKLVMLTPKCWENFIYYCEQIDNEAKELNLKT